MFHGVQNVSQLSYTIVDFLIAKILTNVNVSATLASEQFVIYLVS